jgi:hypothetical protein
MFVALDHMQIFLADMKSVPDTVNQQTEFAFHILAYRKPMSI